jgi:hypothetical protein
LKRIFGFDSDAEDLEGTLREKHSSHQNIWVRKGKSAEFTQNDAAS